MAKVLVDRSQSVYGISVVQSKYTGLVYFLTPCCKTKFNFGDRCSECEKSYEKLAIALSINLNYEAPPDQCTSVAIRQWISKVVGAPVTIEVSR